MPDNSSGDHSSTAPAWRSPSPTRPSRRGCASGMAAGRGGARPATCRAGSPFVTEAASHLLDAGGKRFRPLLVLLAAEAGRPPGLRRGRSPRPASSRSPTSASLYHDDVMDEAALRRGADSANARWDNHVAILTGDFLFAKSSELTAQLGADAVRIQAETFTRLVEGQILETVAARARRGPARALPRRRRRQDRLADRHLGALRRPLRRRHRRGRGGADGVRRDRRLRLPALRRHPRHRLRLGESGKTPGTDLREGVPDAAGADGPGLHRPGRRPAARAARRRPHRRRAARRGARPAAQAPRHGRGPRLRRRPRQRGQGTARPSLPDGPVRAALEAFADVVAVRSA